MTLPGFQKTLVRPFHPCTKLLMSGASLRVMPSPAVDGPRLPRQPFGSAVFPISNKVSCSALCVNVACSRRFGNVGAVFILETNHTCTHRSVAQHTPRTAGLRVFGDGERRRRPDNYFAVELDYRPEVEDYFQCGSRGLVGAGLKNVLLCAIQVNENMLRSLVTITYCRARAPPPPMLRHVMLDHGFVHVARPTCMGDFFVLPGVTQDNSGNIPTRTEHLLR